MNQAAECPEESDWRRSEMLVRQAAKTCASPAIALYKPL
jgi:hypothetical protein